MDAFRRISLIGFLAFSLAVGASACNASDQTGSRTSHGERDRDGGNGRNRNAGGALDSSDRLEGNADDASGNGNHGIDAGYVDSADGIVGQASSHDRAHSEGNASDPQDVRVPQSGGLAPSAASTRYVTGPQSGKPLTIALSYLRAHAAQLGLGAADLSDLSVSNQYTDDSSGVTHIYLQQQYKAIGVFNAITVVNIAADGSIMNVGNRFVPDLSSKVRMTAPRRSAGQGVKDAALAFGLDLKQEPRSIEVKGDPARTEVFDKAGISRDPIPVKLMYATTSSGVALAWNITINQLDGQHWWNANVDANTGDLLSQVDYVAHNDAYDVVPPPQESPLDGGRSIVFSADFFDPVASPHGWLDSLLTVGNNVHAADDFNGDGTPDPGTEAGAGASLLFDFPLDLTQDPKTYAPAAVTNLFFWNNYMHDLSYHYGFTEAAGNFQVNNYGRGGLEADAVVANDLVGYGFFYDNSNFSAPPDGTPPRMQMYVWRDTRKHAASVTVTDPEAIASNYNAAWGPWGSGDVTAIVSLPSGASPGCSPADFTNFPAGHIALVDRGGGCLFSPKVRNAQAAGAVALIIVNNVSDPFTGNLGPDQLQSQPTIPGVLISQADGATLKSYLPDPGVVATVSNPPHPNRDGSLDNQIIAHEYTHGISIRLTGGAANSTCLFHAEREGEGWSDFMALAVTAKPDQTATTPRSMASYADFGNNLRHFASTTDIAVNPLTYDAIKTNSETHFVGEVWNAMLWEMYWNLVDKYGFNPNLFDDYTTGGNTLAIQLVVDGLKLQPCTPGFVDARDAILLADQQDTGGANQCPIWRAFAKRGLGADASQGDPNSVTDGTQDFIVRTAVCGQASPSRLASTTPPGFPATQTLNVKNPGLAGGNAVSWTITEAASNCSNPSDLGWVSESKTSGITSDGGSTPVQVTFGATGLAAGQYSGLLCISSGDQSYPTTSIPISLTVPQAFSGNTSKPITVSSGDIVYLSPGTAVGGSVTVNAGGSLWADNVTIGGSLSSNGAGTIQLCRSTVKGSASVSQTTGLVAFGNNNGPIPCSGNSISSKATITDNRNGVEFIGNTVKGPLTVTGNAGIVDVSGNNVSGRMDVQQ